MCDCVDDKRIKTVLQELLTYIIKFDGIHHIETHFDKDNHSSLFNLRVCCYGYDRSNTSVIFTPPYYPEIARFCLTEMPGCCGIIISHDTYIDTKYRNQGIGQYLMSVKEMIAKAFNYGEMTATVLSNNVVERHILEKNGWVLKNDFKNPKTNNDVLVYFKRLKYDS